MKALVFTEFVQTQDMLLGLLEEAGVPAVMINGTMGLAERALAQQAFRDHAQIMVSTDAGGEGINLQFAHVVVNWDLPWSPSRLEQRIGRVDRIGQTHTVRAFNLVCEHSVEARVVEVLGQKLGVILDELGADKRGDILESASHRVDDLWTAAIVHPDRLQQQAEQFASQTRKDADRADRLAELIEQTQPTVHAASVERLAALVSAATTACTDLGHPVIDPLDALANLPEVAPAEPCPVLRIPDSATGWLAVWEVTPDGSRRSAVAVFQPDRGLVRPDAAVTAWDRCCFAPDVVDHQTPNAEEWERIVQDGVDHADPSGDASRRRRGLHPAWGPPSACHPDHYVKRWLTAQVAICHRRNGVVVILDPDGAHRADARRIPPGAIEYRGHK